MTAALLIAWLVAMALHVLSAFLPTHVSMRSPRLIVRRPFKGTWFYEWQVGALVLQVRHADLDQPRFLAWRDPHWRR